jgi:hypothetical protein
MSVLQDWPRPADLRDAVRYQAADSLPAQAAPAPAGDQAAGKSSKKSVIPAMYGVFSGSAWLF